MRAFVTGATGFIGGKLAESLRARGDEVVALVRTPAKAAGLESSGCATVEGDLSNEGAIRRAAEGCDAVFHVAARYEIGVRERDRQAFWDANVRGTERVLRAAEEAGATRIVYVSTAATFGDTRGKEVDETYRRDEGDGFLSIYDATKYRAHQLAEKHAANNAPVLIAMPGAVYGPNDPSQLGSFINLYLSGKLKLMTFPDAGFNFVHVDDVVNGLLAVHAPGRVGHSYALGGQNSTNGELIRILGRLTGRKVPRRTMPPALMKMAIPMGPLVGKLMNQGPNLRELIRVVDGITVWFSDEKARRELGYASRDLETGLRQTLGASAA
ncbi:MAG: NAD-dependent epimerase/dehydratase family protein [Actinomycetota bacterium]